MRTTLSSCGTTGEEIGIRQAHCTHAPVREYNRLVEFQTVHCFGEKPIARETRHRPRGSGSTRGL